MNNEKGGKVAFMDHKSGKGSTVGETMNAGDMTASGNHMFDKTTNSGNFMAMPRTFDAKGNPVKLQLVDLATFGNIVNKGGAQMSFTGDHAVKNLQNEKKGMIKFEDHKDGKKTMVKNTINKGDIAVQGNHAFENIQNEEGGKTIALERKFPDKKEGKLLDQLLNLVTFGNFTNTKGGTTVFKGEHKIGKLTNKEGANLKFEDHKKGLKTTVGETKNEKGGNISVSGNHAFDKVENMGNIMSMPRAFDDKGNAVKMVLLI